MKKILLKQALIISKSNLAILQDERLHEVKGGRGLQLEKVKTKGPKCSCISLTCNTSPEQAIQSNQIKSY